MNSFKIQCEIAHQFVLFKMRNFFLDPTIVTYTPIFLRPVRFRKRVFYGICSYLEYNYLMTLKTIHKPTHKGISLFDGGQTYFLILLDIFGHWLRLKTYYYS